MKKIISILLICVLTSTTVLANNGIYDVLSEFNIMTGDPDGNLRLDDYVSRAEFTKIAVNASSYKNSVAVSLAISPFPDVTYKHWAAPYVRVGVTGGIVSGYPDGTFQPENTVLYEEAITMLLRILGYTDEDFGAAWPSGQIGLANNLDMTDNVDSSAGQAMTRRQVAQLVYNTLKTKQKNQQNALVSVFDATIQRDVTLVASSREDSSIASDEIFTSNGTYTIDEGFDTSAIGKTGDAVIKDSGKLAAFVPESSASAQEYIVYSVLSDKVMAYKNGTVSQIVVSDDTTAYKGKSKMTFSALKSQLELGDKLIVSKSNTGNVDYVTYGKGDVQGPVTTINQSFKENFGIDDNVSVSRNGASASVADIQNYDVVYYLKDLNMLMAYSNKVTGIYEKATPNRDVLTSVTVSGKDYEIEGSAAFNKLYSGGSFEYGDTVTLLLGRGNKVADVITPGASADGVSGYLTETGTKSYSTGDVTTSTNYYVKIVQPDGVEYEYITDKNYSDKVNQIVELSFKDGYARLVSITKKAGVSGTFDWDKKKLGSTKLSRNINIIDVDSGAYSKVYPQRLDGLTIKPISVLYASKNSEGEISKLILDNVTNDAATFGIITSLKAGVNNTSIEYIVEGNRYQATVKGEYSADAKGAVKISGSIQKPDTVSSLIGVVGKITDITGESLTANNKTYKISDKVQVYKRTSAIDGNYSLVSINDVLDGDYTISAYYDKDTTTGGRIRIIIAK